MSLVLISFTKKMNVIMSGFWKVGGEGVEYMIWQVPNESYEAKLGESKIMYRGCTFNNPLSFQLLDFLADQAN